MTKLQIDRDRLWQSLMDMAAIGATPKSGSRRLALSDEDKQGRDAFVEWCRAAGCTVSHNEEEWAAPDDLAAGCNVLLHAILDRAG